MDTLIALVTGANKGIGKEIARELVSRGHVVYAGCRDRARGEAAAAEIGGDIRPLLLDVTDPESIAAAAAQVGTLDILVNNAGISGEPQSPVDEGVEEYRRVYETNVFGVVAVTDAFLPSLRASRHPRIVNISSGVGSLARSAAMPESRGGMAAYRSSKAALNAVTIYYAQALDEEGIKVNALAPGIRRTDLNALAAAADGDPAEAARAAADLALLPDDGPSGTFVDWNGAPVPW